MSTDEKTGIPALARAAPTNPLSPGVAGQAGQTERPEDEDVRHGPQGLTATFAVATGKQLAPRSGATRPAQDFVTPMARTVAPAPDDRGSFSTAQLTTHQSESLVQGVANPIGETDELGEKGKAGSLKSLPTRAAFLSYPEPRIRFVYTPKHCSWLNQIEMWFSLLVRRLRKRASGKSTAELRQRSLEFIAYFTATLAKPFQWTYTGRPLTV